MPRSPFRGLAERTYLELVSHPKLSQAVAHVSDMPIPQPLREPALRAFASFYGVDLTESARPLSDYQSLNDFFTRRLRPDARPIASEAGLLVSPADARLAQIGKVPPGGQLLQLKGHTYSLDELLGEDASRFEGGVHATLYLSPKDYHRVHTPEAGTLTRWNYIPGRRYPVNELATTHIHPLYTQNERLVMFLKAQDLELAVVMVGAANVSRITLPAAGYDKPGMIPHGPLQAPTAITLSRGQELGVFNLGSTVVLLADKPTLRPVDSATLGSPVRLGTPLFEAQTSSQ